MHSDEYSSDEEEWDYYFKKGGKIYEKIVAPFKNYGIKEKNITRSPTLSNWIQQAHHEKVGNFYLIHPDNQLVPGSFGQVNVPTVSN